jgi:Domain of unknown function (DUF3291)
MAPVNFDLVHFNLALSRAPLDHPSMAGFASQLDAVNRLAEASPGFVWTAAEGEAGDAMTVFGSALVLVNISTWRSLDDLRRFVYQGMHGRALGRRREWFQEPRGPAYVLWWTEAGHRPNWVEGRERLGHLGRQGPTPHAFTFERAFSPPGELDSEGLQPGTPTLMPDSEA